MSIRKDEVQVSVTVDGKQGLNELGKLEAQAADFKSTIKETRKAADECTVAMAKVAEITPKIDAQRAAVEKLQTEENELKATVRASKKDSEERNAAMARLQEITPQLTRQTRELAAQERQVGRLQTSITALKPSADAYTAAMEQLDQLTPKIAKQREELGIAGMTAKQLANAARDVAREMASLTAGTEKYEQLAAKERELTAALNEQRAARKAAKQDLNQVAERINVEVVIDGAPATNQLNRLEAEAIEYEKHLGTLKRGTAEWAAANERLGATRGSIAELRRELGLSGMTLQQLKRYAQELDKEITETAVRGTAHYEQLVAESQKVGKAISAQQKEVSGLSGFWKSVSTEVKQFGMLAVGALGLQFLGQQVTSLIEKNAKLADSFSDIQKTTGMTEAEVTALNASFARMNTRTTTAELREMAIAAGQIGIAKDDILDFANATDKINVSLGDEFQGGAAEVTKVMGGLRNVFSDIKSDDVAADMLHIGNAINVLASEGAATGPVVADMANRIGGVGLVLGATSGQVLGLAATMQELNIETERGATAVTKILQKMASEPEKFAKTAGLSVRDFRRLVDTNLNAAFIAVVKGAAGSQTAATQLAATLDKMGVDGAGASEVIAKLGQNTELLTEKQGRAATALGETTSIMEEFNTKNNNAAANLERISKWFGGLFVNSSFKKSLNDVTESLAKMLGLIDEVDVATRKFEQRKGASDKLRRDVMPLVKEYEQLVEVTDRSAKEQARLDQLIQQITAAVPRSASEWTAQGKAVGINTDKVREYALELDGVLNGDRKAALVRLNKELADVQRQIQGSLPALNEQKVTIRVSGLEKGQYRTESAKMTDDEIRAERKRIEDLSKRAEQLQDTIDHISGKQSQAEMRAEWKRGEQEDAARLAKLQQGNKAAAAEADGLLEALEKRIKAAQERMQKAGSESGILRAKADIEKLEKERDRLTGVTAERLRKEAEERRKAQEQQHAEARKGLAELEKLTVQATEKVALEQMGADRREIVQIRQKYDVLKADALRFTTDSRLTAQERADALLTVARVAAAEELEVDQKKREQRQKREEESWQAYLDVKQRRASLDVLIASNDYNAAEATGDLEGMRAALDVRQQMLSREIDARMQAELDTIPLTAEHEQQRNLIIQKAEEEKRALRLQTHEQLKALERQAVESVLQFLGSSKQLFDAQSALLQQREQVELDAMTRSTDRRLAALDKQHDAEVAVADRTGRRLTVIEARTQTAKAAADAKYQKQRDAIQAQQDAKELAIRRKQAERQKTSALFNVLTTTPQAIMQAWAAGPFLGPILAGLAAAAGALQLQAINEQEPPAFQEGGFTDAELQRMPKKNLAREGGLLTGGPYLATVNEKGSEYIAPHWMLTHPVAFRHIEALEAIRTGSAPPPPAYAAGGTTGAAPVFTAPVTTAPTPGPTNGATLDAATVQQLTAQLTRLNTVLSQPLTALAYFDLLDLERRRQELLTIQKNASK